MRSRSTVYKQPEYARGKPKKFGDARWDFIKQCKHDLNENLNCPTCRLIERATASHFALEYENRRVAKEEGLIRRARMRYILLECWARSQGSLYGQSLVGNYAEISFTDNSVKALNTLGENGSEKAKDYILNVIRMLRRRKQVLEVGQYAIILIQRFIRGFCCRKKFKLDMLKRFEYIYSRSGIHYLDKETNTKWYSPPFCFKNDVPLTPRTAQRKLASTESKYKARERLHKDIMKRIGYDPAVDVWREDSNMMIHQRQLVVLRDVIALAMAALKGDKESKNKYESSDQQLNPMVTDRGGLHSGGDLPSSRGHLSTAGSRPSKKTSLHSVLAEDRGPSPLNSARSKPQTARSVLSAIDSTVTLSGVQTEHSSDVGAHLAGTYKNQDVQDLSEMNGDTISVWVAPSAPMPSLRTISLSMALHTPPLEEEAQQSHRTFNNPADGSEGDIRRGEQSLTASTSTLSVSASSHKAQSMAATHAVDIDSTEVGRWSVNTRLLILEERAHACLRCQCPEDVIRVLASEELQPALSSAAQIGVDEFDIWDGGLEVMTEEERAQKDEEKQSLLRLMSTEMGYAAGAGGEEAKQGSTPAPRGDRRSYVLPVHVQLHPWRADRTPGNTFR